MAMISTNVSPAVTSSSSSSRAGRLPAAFESFCAGTRAHDLQILPRSLSALSTNFHWWDTASAPPTCLQAAPLAQRPPYSGGHGFRVICTAAPHTAVGESAGVKARASRRWSGPPPLVRRPPGRHRRPREAARRPARTSPSIKC
jgi:hypothetical protein